VLLPGNLLLIEYTPGQVEWIWTSVICPNEYCVFLITGSDALRLKWRLPKFLFLINRYVILPFIMCVIKLNVCMASFLRRPWLMNRLIVGKTLCIAQQLPPNNIHSQLDVPRSSACEVPLPT
jgi:hypothetical protein